MLGGLLSAVFYGLLLTAVFKLLVISRDLAEIKELLKRTDLLKQELLKPHTATAPAAAPEYTIFDREE